LVSALCSGIDVGRQVWSWYIRSRHHLPLLDRFRMPENSCVLLPEVLQNGDSIHAGDVPERD